MVEDNTKDLHMIFPNKLYSLSKDFVQDLERILKK